MPMSVCSVCVSPPPFRESVTLTSAICLRISRAARATFTWPLRLQSRAYFRTAGTDGVVRISAQRSSMDCSRSSNSFAARRASARAAAGRQAEDRPQLDRKSRLATVDKERLKASTGHLHLVQRNSLARADDLDPIEI